VTGPKDVHESVSGNGVSELIRGTIDLCFLDSDQVEDFACFIEP